MRDGPELDQVPPSKLVERQSSEEPSSTVFGRLLLGTLDFRKRVHDAISVHGSLVPRIRDE